MRTGPDGFGEWEGVPAAALEEPRKLLHRGPAVARALLLEVHSYPHLPAGRPSPDVGQQLQVEPQAGLHYKQVLLPVEMKSTGGTRGGQAICGEEAREQAARLRRTLGTAENAFCRISLDRPLAEQLEDRPDQKYH